MSLLGACTDEDIIRQQTMEVVEGVPVTVTLHYAAAQSAIQTRTAQSEETERTIHRLYAIAFDEDGNVAGRNAYENVSNDTGKGTIQFSVTSGHRQIFLVGNPGSAGTLSLATLRAIQTLDDFKNLTSTLNTAGNISRMMFLMVGQMTNNNGDTDIAIDSTGQITNATAPIPLQRVDSRITFKVTTGNKYADMTFTPKYYQVFNIPNGTYLWPREKDETTEEQPYHDYSEQMVANGEEGYSSSGRALFDGKKLFEGDSKETDYFEFYLPENRLNPKAYIYPENNANGRESQKSGWNGEDYYKDAENLYALRERKIKGSPTDNATDKPGQEYELTDEWVFANPHSTYVTIHGTLSYQDTEAEGVGKFITAEVAYTIHLGSTGNEDKGKDYYNDPDLANNYDTRRNTHYTYNVTINGVNSMKVEVVEEEGRTEQRPGVEGSVIVAGGQVKSVDAHFCRHLITLTRGNILSGLSWAVSTPLQNGMKVFNKELVDKYIDDNYTDISALQTDIKLNDYKWVKFGINKEYPSKGTSTDQYYSRKHVLKYPGDDAYDGGKGKTDPAPAFGGDGKESAYYNWQTVKLYDVNQLLNHLYVEAQNENSTIFDRVDSNRDNDVVTISVFIDEYVYFYDPGEYYTRHWNEADVADLQRLWKETVNGDNRMLHICEGGAIYSPDGQTSWAESVVTISQTPIYTFYNPQAEELKSAWGTESIMEVGDSDFPNGELDAKNVSWLPGNHPNTDDNGRQNQLNIISTDWDLKWSDVVSVDNPTESAQLKDGYQNIWYACLLRNRDLDGDDIVDPEEIRWYLASIDQLSDIWVGEDAIPNAKLYTAEITDNFVPGQHYASSSYHNGSPSDTWLLWAEEGVSRSQRRPEPDKDENSDWQTRRNQYKDQAYPYRCLRNLGQKLENMTDIPVLNDYVETSTQTRIANGETYTEKVIDLSSMNANAIRGYTDVPLPSPLSERDEYRNNRPYSKLAVIQSSTYNSSGVYYGEWFSIYKDESNDGPCPNGYRVPNQRELILLHTTFPELFKTVTGGDDAYACKTSFSLRKYKPYSSTKDEDPDGGLLPNGATFEGLRSSRAGYVLYSNGNFSIFRDTNKLPVYVRCVRDVTE